MLLHRMLRPETKALATDQPDTVRTVAAPTNLYWRNFQRLYCGGSSYRELPGNKTTSGSAFYVLQLSNKPVAFVLFYSRRDAYTHNVYASIFGAQVFNPLGLAGTAQ